MPSTIRMATTRLTSTVGTRGAPALCNDPAHANIEQRFSTMEGAIVSLQTTIAKLHITLAEHKVAHDRIILRACLEAEALMIAEHAALSMDELGKLRIRSFDDASAWISRRRSSKYPLSSDQRALVTKLESALSAAQRMANKLANDSLRSRVRKVAWVVAHPDLAAYNGTKLLKIANGPAFPAPVLTDGASGRVVIGVVSKNDAVRVVRLYLHARAKSLAVNATSNVATAAAHPAPALPQSAGAAVAPTLLA